jgi:hypothetical protein
MLRLLFRDSFLAPFNRPSARMKFSGKSFHSANKTWLGTQLFFKEYINAKAYYDLLLISIKARLFINKTTKTGYYIKRVYIIIIIEILSCILLFMCSLGSDIIFSLMYLNYQPREEEEGIDKINT